ncbi:hypothetical protein T439DRAFT_47352 [Meredithblackwellia eburnea MCA 4105]
MLTQSDLVRYLGRQNPPPEQHEAYQILWAYIYSKSSRGSLPSETLAKILSVQRKLVLRNTDITPQSPIGRAFEAAKTQLIAVNRKWVSQGPQAFGALGQIGCASSDDARQAWTKATDGKVTRFDDGMNGRVAVDAGRVLVNSDAPPLYQPGSRRASISGDVAEDEALTAMATVPVANTAPAPSESDGVQAREGSEPNGASAPPASTEPGSVPRVPEDEGPGVEEMLSRTRIYDDVQHRTDSPLPGGDQVQARTETPINGTLDSSDKITSPPVAAVDAPSGGTNGVVDVEAGRQLLAKMRAERMKKEEEAARLKDAAAEGQVGGQAA